MEEKPEQNQLEIFHQQTLQNFLPVIVTMAIVCLFGIVGNGFTIAFYGFASRKTPTVFMITALACVDLCVCALIIPNMAEMGVNVKYTNAAACKVMHFFGHWTIVSSILLLWFISIDRYRHVCCPFKKQIDFIKAKWAVGIIITATFLLSVRDFANFDIIEFPLPNVDDNTTLGHYCTTTDDPSFGISVQIFHAVDALLVVMILITLCFTYSKIIWTIKRKKFTPSYGNKQATEHEGHSMDDANPIPHLKTAPPIEDNVEKKEKDNSGISSTTKIKKTERSITLMMFAVSVVFAFCFIPYFIVKLGVRSYKSASQLELGAGTQIALRLVYVNSFANPYIFCIFNPQFRRFIGRAISMNESSSVFTSKTGSSKKAGTDDTAMSSQQSSG